ncbi:PKD domain-containing protein [Fluviicola sp.]|uniref:PKD domain-containing protein n=1 Tax=Fluviicola sp. TaxID=1917219 RepID=UPI0031D1C5E8
MKKCLLLLLLTPFHYSVVSAQCDINASASSTTITCGQSVNLTAYGSSTGQMVLNETFNTGGFGSGWSSTPGSTNFNNPCSSNGVDGTTHAWMGSSTSVPRTLTSAPYNLTSATAGVSICFDLLFAEQGDAAPCEGPDEPDEGVYLQYSINGGATWIDIHYFDPNGGNDPQLTNWNNWCFALPAAAITSNTLIRWHQTADSGADYDHWGIDNVQIFQNDINAEVIWLHDNYSYGIGNPGGVNPNPVTPTTTTTYTAQITTGTGQVCTTTVTVNVLAPVYDVQVAANPTTVCAGSCSTISGTGQIILDPGGIETYENNEFSVVASGNASVNINVQGINTSSISNGLIQNVTINGFSFSGSFFCTSFGGCNCNGTNIGFGSTCNLTASGFTVTLTSPGGCSIVLAPAGAASGNYNSTVFVPVGGTNIGTGFPTGGPWNPNQPFSNLNGCDPNGVWTLSFNAPGLGLGIGTLQGWSITFNDPPIYAPVNYSWSPTTGLSNPNSINTQACPTSTTNYVLTVSNGTPGCPTHTENVQITVDPCGGCIPPAVNVNPITTCSPVMINLNSAIASGSAPATLSYHATQTDAQNNTSPISQTVASSGTYWLRYEDPGDPICFGTAQIVVTINPADNPAFIVTNFCPGTSNQASGIATPGGTFSFNPVPGDGATINASTGAISNATSGTTYTVQYTTNGACPATATQTVTASGFSFSTTVIPENCGNADGEISITPTGGTPGYTYSINGGTAQNSGTFTTLTAGSYSITVTDNTGCQSSGSATVGSVGGPVIDNLQIIQPSCGTGCNGSITATVSGGSAPYTYAWFDASGNAIGTNVASSSNLCPGTYSLEVSDASGTCPTIDFATLNAPSGGEDASFTLTDFCEGTTNAASGIATPGGSFVFNPLPTDGAVINPATGSISNGIGGTTYTVEYTTGGACPGTDTQTVTVHELPVISGSEVCIGTTIPFSATGTPASASPWSSSDPAIATISNTGMVNGIAGGTAVITFTNANGCSSTYTLQVVGAPAISGNTTVCNGTNSSLSGSGTPDPVNPWASSNPAVATIDNNGLVSGIAPGTTTITYQNSGGCSTSVSFTVVDAPQASFTSNLTEGCAPQNIVFTNTGGASSGCVWTFEGLGTQNGCGSVTQTFQQEGIYDVTLTVTNAYGCTNSATIADMITIHPAVIASFNADVTEQTVLNPVFQFTNTSTGANNYTWNFDDGTVSTSTNTVHVYEGTASVYTVVLAATNDFGCRDTARIVISVTDELYWYVPNSFTPDGNEVNNYFVPVFSPGFDIKDFSFLIFNRWGEIVFESKDMYTGWDGTYAGTICKEGIYTYKITLKERNMDKRYEITGHVNLIK